MDNGLGLIFTAIGCTAAATSALVYAIAGVKQALAVHIAEHKVEHERLDAKILKLERRRK